MFGVTIRRIWYVRYVVWLAWFGGPFWVLSAGHWSDCKELQRGLSLIQHLGLSENRVYPQWNSHLVGIMISKAIGFRGTNHFQTNPYLDKFVPWKQKKSQPVWVWAQVVPITVCMYASVKLLSICSAVSDILGQRRYVWTNIRLFMHVLSEFAGPECDVALTHRHATTRTVFNIIAGRLPRNGHKWTDLVVSIWTFPKSWWYLKSSSHHAWPLKYSKTNGFLGDPPWLKKTMLLQLLPYLSVGRSAGSFRSVKKLSNSKAVQCVCLTLVALVIGPVKFKVYQEFNKDGPVRVIQFQCPVSWHCSSDTAWDLVVSGVDIGNHPLGWTYGGWRKSCTTLDGGKPINSCRILKPSTVSLLSLVVFVHITIFFRWLMEVPRCWYAHSSTFDFPKGPFGLMLLKQE